jgi:hypothetical protein
MARYDRGYDYGLRGYDQAYGRRWAGGAGNLVRGGYGPGAGGYPAMRARQYDRDMDRGYRAERQRHDAWYGGGGRYDADYGYRGDTWLPNRVTRPYNLDYVHPRPGERPINYAHFGGDVEGRVGDLNEYARPYITHAGTRTWRGAERPVGWERAYNRYPSWDDWGGPGW